MDSTRWLKKFANVLLKNTPIATAIAGKLGVPYMETIGVIIQAAAVHGGTGEERMQSVLDKAMVGMPEMVQQLEKKFNKPVDPKAVATYVQAIIQAHYDLMQSFGEVPKP